MMPTDIATVVLLMLYCNDLITELLLCWSSHFIVPELGPDVNFTYASHKAVEEYKEAKAVCVKIERPFALSYHREALFFYEMLFRSGWNVRNDC